MQASKTSDFNGLRICNIKKRFPGVTALDNVSINIEEGSIHGIIGENGAGKSTLMNIITGKIKPDQGNIYLNNKKLPLGNIQEIINRGIGMVHQHFMLVPTLTVLENIILGAEPNNNIGFIDYEKAYNKVQSLMKKYNLTVDLSKKIKELNISSRQRVEILKTIYNESDYIILDEPTAVLTPIEIDGFLKNVNNLANKGKTVLFISHKLKEVMKISDKISILRNGNLIETKKPKNTNESELATLMVGEDIEINKDEKISTNGQNTSVILKVNNVKTQGPNTICKNVNFELRKKEICGLVGIEGSGQQEIAKAILGLVDVEEGKINLKGENINSLTVKEVRQKGVKCIPGSREKEGLVTDQNLIHNTLLGFHNNNHFKKGPLLNWRAVSEKTNELIQKFNIKTTGSKFPAKLLSGGNQQKLLFGRESAIEQPELLIAIQPTRGLDIKSVKFIHNYILDLKNKGVAIILVSTKLNEVIKLSDEILVFREGEIVDKLKDKRVSKKKIGLLMGGSNSRKECNIKFE